MKDTIDLITHLEGVWHPVKRSIKMDWQGLEDTLVDVLTSQMSDADKVAFCKETIDAYTKRGHFSAAEYPGQKAGL